MAKQLRNSLLLLLLSLSIVYLALMPHVPMPLDSAEMALHGITLGVMHPPGYPLITLYYGIFVRILPFLKPVVAVGIATVLISLASLCLAGYFIGRQNGRNGLLLILSLGLSPLYLHYSITPEVFIGLQFFAVAFFCILIEPALYLDKRYLFLLSLSVLHHHLIIIMLPALGFAFWENKRALSAHVWAIVFGAISLSGYLVLLWLNPDSIYSWGYIRDVTDVLDHFLRKQYGTFNLVSGASASGITDRLILCLETILLNAFVPLLVLAYLSYTRGLKIFNKPASLLAGVVSLYIVSFSLFGGITLDLIGLEVIKRFYLLPVTLLHLLAALLIPPEVSRKESLVLCVIIGIAGIIGFSTELREKRGGLRELSDKYHRQLLASIPHGALANMAGDTAYFSTAYYQASEGIRKDLLLWINSLSKETIEKFHRERPATTDLYANGVFHAGNMAILTDSSDVEWHEFGIFVRQGIHRIKFRCDPRIVYPGPSFPLKQYNTLASISLRYGQCDFYRGLYLLREQKIADAERAFYESIKKNPWMIFAQERLCYTRASQRKPTVECDKRLDILIKNTDPRYFADKKFMLTPAGVPVEW